MKKGFFYKKKSKSKSLEFWFEKSKGQSGNDKIENLKKELSSILLSERDYVKAEEVCNRIMKINAYECEILLKRALIRENMEKYKDALNDVSLFLHIYPFNLEG